jgi:2-polyprenyl-6-hydroxyphenyl methylase/3-demethylubiquinone-9 3-methyltransferase
MRQVECKICGGNSALFTTVDFLRHCNKQLQEPNTGSGVKVEYYRCSSCAFIFTNFIDDMTRDDLRKHIYNEDYVKFDPLYPKIRPQTNARFLSSVIHDAFPGEKPAAILDYGAGNGMLSRLVANHVAVSNYDSLNPDFDHLPTGRAFDLIFCAEVVEHMPFPSVFATDWRNLLSPRGCALFSTEIQPPDIASLRGDWWYIGPRNGHVSLYSEASLHALFKQNEMIYENLNNTWHVAFHRHDHHVDIDAVKEAVASLPTGFILI